MQIVNTTHMESFLDGYGIISVLAAAGFICRLSMIKVDYRQYPSYPQSYFSHILLGFIAAVPGAVFIPSIIEKNYAAVTFLALAGSQFREIRSVERRHTRCA